MKKRMIVCGTAALSVLAFSSCTIQQACTETHYSEARILGVTTKSEVKTVRAELKVDPVRVEDTWSFTEDEVATLGTIEELKARASFLTLQKHGADELIAPLYNVDFKNNCPGLNGATVTVIGYTAKLVNWQSSSL